MTNLIPDNYINLTFKIHPPTIDLIRYHVHQKPDGRNARFRVKKQKDINPYSPVGMQWMKSNAAASWIKKGIGQKMIQIYQHSGEKNQVNLFPVISEK